MAKGTTFGTLHSNTDLSLIQQSVEISPAEPRTSFVDVPGADGSKDLTEALGVGVKYKDRKIKWTFALYPGDNWELRKQTVSGYINGIACAIVIDDDPNYYYQGRVEVKDYKVDGLLKQITVEAVCRPYKLHLTDTVIARDDLTTSYKNLNITNDRMPVVPEITVSAETTLLWNGNTYTISAGTHTVPEIRFTYGVQTLKAKLTSGTTGTISLQFKEGAL